MTIPNSIEIIDLKQLGNILKQRRKLLGVTQEQAAALCNVGPRFIGEMERGKQTAEIGKFLQVLRGYGFQLSLNTRELKSK